MWRQAGKPKSPEVVHLRRGTVELVIEAQISGVWLEHCRLKDTQQGRRQTTKEIQTTHLHMDLLSEHPLVLLKTKLELFSHSDHCYVWRKRGGFYERLASWRTPYQSWSTGVAGSCCGAVLQQEYWCTSQIDYQSIRRKDNHVDILNESEGIGVAIANPWCQYNWKFVDKTEKACRATRPTKLLHQFCLWEASGRLPKTFDPS